MFMARNITATLLTEILTFRKKKNIGSVNLRLKLTLNKMSQAVLHCMNGFKLMHSNITPMSFEKISYVQICEKDNHDYTQC